jgi:hypothetical protein
MNLILMKKPFDAVSKVPIWAHNPRFPGSNPGAATNLIKMNQDRWACKTCLVVTMCNKLCQRAKLYSDICYEACTKDEINKCTKNRIIVYCPIASQYTKRMEDL